MSYICDGHECEYTRHCLNRMETTSYAESLNGNRTFTRIYHSPNYPECHEHAKRQIEILKSIRISKIIHRYEIAKYTEDKDYTLKVLKYALKTVGDITEYEMMERFDTIAEEMEN